ncbi:DUF4352 domain-containing protein [Nocardia farcinica]|uniref:DUF4352 domain-containing protein n=1 Tax=Nocardia farcinica TaxID=37329 RepID=UPI0012FF1B62|nr:DUF4352 domain-containing protein [Nocardia farcinica]
MAIAGFFGVVGLGVVNGAGKTSDKASAELALPAAGVAPVRDGQLQFTVKKVETGVTHTGGSVFGEDPLGQFIVVTVEIANVGTIPASAPSWDDQQLIDDQGRRYDGHWGASDSLNKDDPRDYNPGLSATVRIAFDVPEGTQPVAIKFADSMLSSGVEASLR